VDLPVETVFVGGGTPTLLSPEDLGRVLRAVDAEFGLADGAEVTTESNPETVDRDYLVRLRAAGFTRVSYGMQSAREHVLRVLDRTHTPGRVPQVVRWAREAGFEHVNLDLIYGTPGETDDDWRASLDAVLAAGPDHVSAYALIVEEGTRLAARIRRGDLPYPDDDVAADRYLAAEAALSAAGFQWYEVSNWARSEAARCRHNVLYWTGGDWLGFGCGAHSTRSGTRWKNVAGTQDYIDRMASGHPVAIGTRRMSPDERLEELLFTGLRLADGVDIEQVGLRSGSPSAPAGTSPHRSATAPRRTCTWRRASTTWTG
jgi:putative oxygen-independent coproporphyrinogen III oxidase